LELDAIAIEFDFVEPLIAGRRFGPQRGQLRLDEAGHIRGLGTRD
jgi:hypothetical protein